MDNAVIVNVSNSQNDEVMSEMNFDKSLTIAELKVRRFKSKF
jgi:hypothetical protein